MLIALLIRPVIAKLIISKLVQAVNGHIAIAMKPIVLLTPIPETVSRPILDLITINPKVTNRLVIGIIKTIIQPLVILDIALKKMAIKTFANLAKAMAQAVKPKATIKDHTTRILEVQI